jgi:predicted DCC family thiol-disulfide oxidoreductase YuxK
MSTNDTQSTEPVDTDHAEPAYEAVLIFDGECPCCSAAATALRQLPEIGVVEWNNDAAQQLLAAQFDDPPFALVLVDGRADRLWIASTAVGELCDRAGIPTLVQDIVADNFERVGDAVRGVAGAKWEPADLDGTRSLNAAAAAGYQTLATNARRTHQTGESQYIDLEDTGYASL